MDDQNKEQTDTTRRDFLKKAGKLAIYTPPVMMAMSSPSFATGFGRSGGQELRSTKQKHKKKFGFKLFRWWR